MEEKIITDTDFYLWAKIRMLERGVSQRALARKFGVPETRISEAMHGKKSGRRYIVPIIRYLGGVPEDFKQFLDAV